MGTGRLTDSSIKHAKPRAKPYRLSDGDGLNISIEPHGTKLWRWRYRFSGREKMLSLGKYPEIGLKEARERCFEERRKLARGVDPATERAAARADLGDTFEAIAEDWLGKLKHLEPTTVGRTRERLKKYIYPSLGKRPIKSITARELLTELRRIEARDKHHTAHRVRAIVGRVMRYAIATGSGGVERDITGDLKGALVPMSAAQHRPAILDPLGVGKLLRALDGYDGQPAVAAALKLAPYVFLRPGELRGAQWSEFDLGGKEPVWRVPGERMKMGKQHLVPLSSQAVAILKAIKPLTGDGELVFPGVRSRSRPISDNTLNAALRRIGYTKEEQTAHGFRSIASTLLNERGVHPDLIELQLAHSERNEVRAAYNQAQRLGERREMMQMWADYLDELKAKAGVP